MGYHYYNEIDRYCCQWLRNLINAGHLPDGCIDSRPIQEVKIEDLTPYTQCHFFAGIGGWSLALRLSGWPEDRPVWTGSCPCQPFSVAGKRKGVEDERHLWPFFCKLIGEGRPSDVIGEQVASKDGRVWLAGVHADLEALGYRFGAADLCSASVGAPHIRQRLYWVAGLAQSPGKSLGRSGQSREDASTVTGLEKSGHVGRERFDGNSGSGTEAQRWGTCHASFRSGCFSVEGLADSNMPSEHKRTSSGEQQVHNGNRQTVEGLGYTPSTRLEEQRREYFPSGERHSGLVGFAVQAGIPEWNGPTIAVKCSDGWRRVSAQPDAFPLAHGVSARMGKLRGGGNAISPPLAAEFIRAYMECRP